jgi:S-adenosylmethionine synthetase
MSISHIKNNNDHYIFTSESVSEGHPDKLCDRISDAIVDLFISYDPYARTAVECLATTGYLLIAGEINHKAKTEISQDLIIKTARDAIRDIGYLDDSFHADKVKIDVRLHAQSADIAVGVDQTAQKDEGAGDQGIMFGYAVNETAELMPAALHYSHLILKALADDRKSGKLSMLGPDAKSQVSLEYQDGKPVRATSVVVSTQHQAHVSQHDVREIVKPYIERILPQGWMCADDQLYINPTGRFVTGGPDGDCGLTGRKIIVDTYGGAAPHGGGAFSGKDPTKVDRSAAYAARYLAKNIVAAKLADKCVIQLSYAIGVSHPISIFVNTYGTGRIPDHIISILIPELMNLSPRGIREHLNLNRPIYARTAAYGHFGRTPDADGGFSWEKTDLVQEIKTILNQGGRFSWKKPE